MADIEQTYYAFLSCSPEDNREAERIRRWQGRRDWSNWLEAALKTYVIPRNSSARSMGAGNHPRTDRVCVPG